MQDTLLHEPNLTLKPYMPTQVPWYTIDVVDGQHTLYLRSGGYIDAGIWQNLKRSTNVTLAMQHRIAVYKTFYNISEEGLNPNPYNQLGSSKMSKHCARTELDFMAVLLRLEMATLKQVRQDMAGARQQARPCQISSTLYNAGFS